jgi:hypothetical protein
MRITLRSVGLNETTDKHTLIRRSANAVNINLDPSL